MTTAKEFVFDIRKKKWYENIRGLNMAKPLVMAFPVRDTTGKAYVYGGLDTGYIERLENGTDFDGEDIISTFRIGDIPLGGWQYQSTIRKVKHIQLAKGTTTSVVTLTHYGDCITTSTETATSDPTVSGKRVAQTKESLDWGNYTFHSIKCSITTDNETIGYEPIGLSIYWKPVRVDIP